MGKRCNDPTDKGETRILYKKSVSTIHTNSRTYSGQSQMFIRSGILHFKKKLSQTNSYWLDNEKEKRDLSIETDMCVLRRYFKNRRNNLSYQEGSSAKSKFSTHTGAEDTAVATTAGCEQKLEAGDNGDTLKNVDVVSLIVDNFKCLLNKWIREYILDNENSQNVETVRDSLLHRLELNAQKDNVSNSTFVYNSKQSKESVKRHSKPKKKKKHSTKGKEKPKAVVKCSCYTIPFQCKNLRIISTLSIPRNFDKSGLMNKDSNGKFLYRLKKISRKNIFLSLKKPEKLFVDSSTFNVLAMSSRSLTKRCATYNDKSKKREIIKRKIAFQPKPQYKNAAESAISIQNNSAECVKPPKKEIQTDMGFDNLPSLVKSIYGNVSPGTSPSYVFLKSDNFTMTDRITSPMRAPIATHVGLGNNESNSRFHGHKYSKNDSKHSEVLSEKDHSDPMITIDFVSHSLEFPPPEKTETTSSTKTISCQRSCYRNDHISKKRTLTKLRRFKTHNSNLNNIKYKHFTYLYNKVNKKKSDTNEFINHFHSIFKYIAEQDGQKNVRLDVHVNVFPIAENGASVQNNTCENQQNITAIYNPNCTSLDTLIEYQETEPATTKESKLSERDSPPEIISLLDGAVSQAKYIIMTENSSFIDDTKDQKPISVSNATVTSKLEITNEINDLKNVIKGLAMTAEKLMNEHLKVKKKTTLKQSQAETTVLYDPAVTNTSTEGSQTPPTPKSTQIHKNKSKGIQISHNFLKNNVHSGFKIKKEPKRPDAAELYTRLMEKSTTYHFIESESILKVTDMTSQRNSALHTGPNDIGLTCSLSQSKSELEVPAEKEKNKLMAFFCDGLSRMPRGMASVGSPLGSQYKPRDSGSKTNSRSSRKDQKQSYQSSPSCNQQSDRNCATSNSDCPEEGRQKDSTNDSNINDPNKAENPILPNRRRSVAAGVIAFLHCFILMMPVAVILIMIYILIRDKLLPTSKSVKIDEPTLKKNFSLMYDFMLSDFGF